MERVSDEWIARNMEIAERNSSGNETVELLGRVVVRLLTEIQERREAEMEKSCVEMLRKNLAELPMNIQFNLGYAAAMRRNEMERVSDEWLDETIPKYSAIDSKSKGANVYLALCELRERRQAEKDATKMAQERENEINVFWNKIAMNYSHSPCIMCPATDGDDCGYWDGTCGHSLRKFYESIAGTPPSENAKEAVLPTPVKQVDGVGVKTWTIKKWFQKINEELDELKNAVLMPVGLDWRPDCDGFVGSGVREIAEEAADTITAITSMLEAMGIDEQARQAAQRRVNEHNRERNRL